MTEKDLFHILSDLEHDEFKKFKWCLKHEKVDDIEPIKQSQLSSAERHDVVDLMVQKYEFAAAVEVMKRVLTEIGRKDLVRKVPNISAGEEGLGMDLPSPMDAVEIEDMEMPVQRFNSLPLHLQGLSLSLKGQETDSHRYGISGQQPSQITISSTSQCDNQKNMLEAGNQFKTLTKPVLRRVHSFNSGQSKDAFAHHPGSTPALKNNSEMPMGMTHPVTVPQVADCVAEDSPVIRHSWQRKRFHSLSMPSPVSSPSVKCTNRPQDENTPVRLHLLCYSPSLTGQETDSHHYGISGQQPSQITISSTSQSDNKENMPETPTKLMSQSHVHPFNSGQSKDTFVHRPGSAPALMLSSPSSVQQLEVYASSPITLRWSSLTSSLNDDDDDDDGFLDIRDNNMENNSEMPMGMTHLVTVPRVADSVAEDSPVIRHSWQQNLFRSLSMPSPVSSPSVKCTNHPGDENTPVRVKRQCSLGGAQVTTIEQDPKSLRTIDASVIDFMDDGTPVKDEEYDGAKSDVKHDVQLKDTHEENAQVVTLSSDSKEVYADALSNTSEVMFGPFLRESMASQLDDALIHQLSPQFEEPWPVITSITPPPTSTTLTTPDTAALDDEANSSPASNDVCVTIKLHRVNLLEEMISQFKDAALLKHPLKYINIDEKGADVDGVSRDVYSAFWTEFMNHRAEGEDLRVPLLALKWQEEEWKSIGRILLKGFQDHGYFPCRLAPVFTMALIFGETEVSDDMLFESLLLYISQSDRDMITSALRGDLSDEDRDELLDLLHRFHVRTVPTQENLRGILLKVAHKQLIQKPRYAAEKMSLVASHRLKDAFVSPQDVLRMYDAKKPTTRKILKLLDASPTTRAENQSFRFLQQYIKGLDDTGLRRMLRFVTGSDVICVNKVEVLFTRVDGLARRPVAHICGPTLKLPSTYTSYPELRTEMDSILAAESICRFSIA